MTKELFNLLDQYISCVIDNKLNEVHPITSDIRMSLQRAEILRDKISKIITTTCGDLK